MSNEKYDKGLAIRTQVLGEAYVNKSIENADDFNRPLQELVTEYCWGHVWGREGLSLKERSMINLAMISALNRPHELKLHIRGALRNGLSREQIREILGNVPFLIPGYGAQGGGADDAVRTFVAGPNGPEGGIVNSSRAVLFPVAGERYMMRGLLTMNDCPQRSNTCPHGFPPVPRQNRRICCVRGLY